MAVERPLEGTCFYATSPQTGCRLRRGTLERRGACTREALLRSDDEGSSKAFTAAWPRAASKADASRSTLPGSPGTVDGRNDIPLFHSLSFSGLSDDVEAYAFCNQALAAESPASCLRAGCWSPPLPTNSILNFAKELPTATRVRRSCALNIEIGGGGAW